MKTNAAAFAAIVLCLSVALVCNPTLAATVTLSTHMLDSLPKATLTVPPKAKPMGNTRNFIPFWHTNTSQDKSGWHRRVVLYDGSRSWREMREALVLPVPSKATFPVTTQPGDIFSSSILVHGQASKAARLTLNCKTPQGTKTIWTSTVNAKPAEKTPKWPSPTTAKVDMVCSELTLEAAPAKEKDSGLWIVWEDPRIDRATPADKAPPYNVVMIVVDALRGDSVGSARVDFPSVSPNIDALAKGGSDFQWGYSAANTTLMSMNTLLLGTHGRSGSFIALWWSGKDRRPEFYKTNPPYITRTLHKSGYVTYGAVHNHLYFPDYKYGVDPGFDVLEDCGKDTWDHPLLTDAAVNFMKNNSSRRFFVQLNLLGPHQPYSPPKECLEKAEKALKGAPAMWDARYVGEICWADKHVGEVVKALQAAGLQNNTLIIVTADHGEVMDGHHQCRSEREKQSCAKLHGLSLYNEEIRVPMIFYMPGTVKPQVVKTPVSHVDIVPTILAINRLPIPSVMSGRSLTPSIVEGKALPEIPIFAERWNASAVIDGKWKLIWHTPKDDICPSVVKKSCKVGSHWVELYDLSTDPHERKDLSQSNKTKADELRKKAAAIKDTLFNKSDKKGPNP